MTLERLQELFSGRLTADDDPTFWTTVLGALIADVEALDLAGRKADRASGARSSSRSIRNSARVEVDDRREIAFAWRSTQSAPDQERSEFEGDAPTVLAGEEVPRRVGR
jgi:hypothetical protein